MQPNNFNDTPSEMTGVKTECEAASSRDINQTMDRHCPRVIKIRNYRKYNPDELVSDLRAQPWDTLYETENVNLALLYFKDIVLGVFNKHAPMIDKRVKGIFCPWLTPEIHDLMNSRDKVLRKARKTGRAEDHMF